MIQWLEIAAFALGLVLAGLLIVVPRFGPGSRQMLPLLLFLPACTSPGLAAFRERLPGVAPADGVRLSFMLILLSAVGGLLAVQAFSHQAHWLHGTIALGLAEGFVALLFAMEPPYALEFDSPEGHLPFAPIGYPSTLFLLILSAVALAGTGSAGRPANPLLATQVSLSGIWALLPGFK